MPEYTLKETMARLDYRPTPAPYRVNLSVPFGDKDQAKALGAKWNPALKTWYIDAGKDMKKFRKWLTPVPKP
jgi:putative DNA primase/helicase